MTEAAVLAFLAAFGITPVLIVALSRGGVLDHPNARSSHNRPTVRGGGLAVAAAALVAISTSSQLSGSAARSFLVVAGLFGIVGFVDDLLSVPAFTRLGLQVLVAFVSLAALLDGTTGAVWWRLIFAAGVLVWLVGFVNAFNFMDGINGISVAQTLVAGATFALIGHSQCVDALATGGLVVAAATLGFAPFNFPRAHVFLGDVGSYFLGAWLAVLVVIGLRASVPIEALLAPVALYLADTAFTLIRRVRRGAPWHEAHHDHVYQQLVERGWSHVAATGLVAGFTTLCSALGMVSLNAGLPFRAVADATAVALVIVYLALPTAIDRRRPEELLA